MRFRQEDLFGNYLQNSHEPMSQARDDRQLKLSSLQNDFQNIKQTQTTYGIPVIGDLFSQNPVDIEETIKSVYFMMKQRVADIDFRQEIRTKMNKADMSNKDLQEQLSKQKLKNDQLNNQIKELQNSLKAAESRSKTEKERILNEKDELSRQLVRIQNKETQYKHELRNKDVQITKLSDTLKDRQAAQTTKAKGQSIECYAPAETNPQFKFSKLNGDSDFNLMVS